MEKDASYEKDLHMHTFMTGMQESDASATSTLRIHLCDAFGEDGMIYYLCIEEDTEIQWYTVCLQQQEAWFVLEQIVPDTMLKISLYDQQRQQFHALKWCYQEQEIDCDTIEVIAGKQQVEQIQVHVLSTIMQEPIETRKEGNVFMEEKQTHSQGSMHIDFYVRGIQGELVKPQGHEVFEVSLMNETQNMQFTLCQENDFEICIDKLTEGCYRLCETSGHEQEITYLIHNEEECDDAYVQVKRNCSTHVLMLFHPCAIHEQQSPLRICKYVRRFDQCLVKPDPSANFKVMLSGCGVCEVFNLNASNNFCVDIDHICYGEYEVKELEHFGYIASYIVNDGCESTSAHICIQEGSCQCVQIINEERNKGSVTISKVIRNSDGTWNKPERRMRFLVTLRSFFCKETFVLDASNDFCVKVENLKEGSYEIKERCMDGYDTTYIVNQGKEENKARFVVMNHQCVDVKVINSQKQVRMGDLRISKYISNAYGDYVKPNVKEEFVVLVSGPCMQEEYVLRAANNWCIILEGLSQGTYKITEQYCHDYETSYRVNGQETSEAIVCLDTCNQEVEIINQRRSYGKLKLNVAIEECDGTRHRPQLQESFDILLESVCESKFITLDACNGFSVLLEDMPQGRLRITQKDSYGYRVLYDVNDTLQHQGVVIMDGEDQQITVVNQKRDCNGLVTIKKWIVDEHGNLHMPDQQQAFSFTLTSRCMQHQAWLNAKNDFCVYYDDLEEGNYEITEDGCEGMHVTYRINGEECDCGRFTLGQEDIEIEIMNPLLPQPILRVQKRILENGEIQKPQPCETFRFLLKGRNCHEAFELSASNDWCVEITDLKNQHYEVKEVGVNCNVYYEINGERMEQGYFLFDQQDMDVVILNEEACSSFVQLQAYMEDNCGNLFRPAREESFEVMIEGDCYKQCFTLDYGNDWCVQLENLPKGEYRVEEMHGAWLTRLVVNDQPQRNMCFVVEDADVNVALLHKEGCHNQLKLQAKTMHLSQDACYEVTVRKQDVQQTYTLHHQNNWCVVLEDIVCGKYHIQSNACNMIYEHQGNCYENGIEVDVQEGCYEVMMWEEQEPNNDITIKRRRKTSTQMMAMPEADEVFEVEVEGNGQKECFVLHKGNHWCIILEGCQEGIYRVQQRNGSDVWYQIDGQEAMQQGYITLRHKPVEMVIYDQEEAGSLLVHALVENADHELETAPADARFEMLLDGEDVQEDFTLTQRNGFQKRFDDLPKGMYQIQAENTMPYPNVRYRIQGENSKDGSFELKQDAMQVDAIFYGEANKHAIFVRKYRKDAGCGCLKRPKDDEVFEIVLMKEQGMERVMLSQDNQWSHTFTDLLAGEYQIKEMSEEGKVTYIVNGGKESLDANIELRGEDAEVKVINASNEEASGCIEICKFIKDAQGKIHYPKEDQSFWIQVKKADELIQRVLLHSANHFFVEVRGLENGVYRIEEENNDSVTYVVNGQEETKVAEVKVEQNVNQVHVINAEMSKTSLTLRKWIMVNGQLQMPDGGIYRMQIQKPDVSQIVELRRENQFMTTLYDLPAGVYMVEELDQEGAQYQVDQGMWQDQAIVNVKQQHEVNILNQTMATGGSIYMRKKMRQNDGTITMPNANDVFYFHVSKPGFNKVYTLDQTNQWEMHVRDLEPGTYVIAEIGGTKKVTYIINGGSERDNGVVEVMHDRVDVDIINAVSVLDTGSITITKYLRDQNGDVIKPFGSFVARVHISKPGYNEIFTLQRSNDWSVRVDDLLDGDYVLSEMDSDMSVSWRIDKGQEVRYAIVSVKGDSHVVDMINTEQMESGVLHLQKWLVDENNEMRIPNRNEQFQVEIQGPITKNVVLNYQNGWRESIRGLVDGVYTIKEANALDYDVSYKINDGNEVKEAKVDISSNVMDVAILNRQRTAKSILNITKYIKDASGTLMPPAEGERYLVEVRGVDQTRTVVLDKQNNFSEQLRDLAVGNYQIVEISNNDAYAVSYRVDEGNEQSEAFVTTRADSVHNVEVLNERRSDQNVVEIFKFMQLSNGEFVKPQANESFRVLLTGSNVHEFYTLDQSNDWHVRITTLSSGEYEVIEQGNAGYIVQYVVNGAASSTTGEFIAEAGSENIVEIINRKESKDQGRIVLEKKIRTTQGDLVIPGNGERFQVRVRNEALQFDEIYTLDALNGYEFEVRNLAYGNYAIEEIQQRYQVSYVVNDGAESDQAVVAVNNDAMQQVLIINSQMMERERNKGQQTISIVLE